MNKVGVIGGMCCALLFSAVELLAQLPLGVDTPADALYQTGIGQLAQKQFAEAETSFQKLRQLEPENSRAFIGLAEAEMGNGKTDDAVSLLKAAVAESPMRQDLRLALGNISVRAGRYDEAVAAFQQVLKGMDPNSQATADIYLRLGETYRRKGDFDNALSALNSALEMRPGDAAALAMIGLTEHAAGKVREAMGSYRSALQADPNNGIVLNNLAFLMADSGQDLDAALEYAQRAQRALPNNPEIADTVGWVYLKKGMVADAAQIFAKLLLRDPAIVNFRKHLVDALDRQKGGDSPALRQLRAALQAPSSPENNETVKALLLSFAH
jgi:tetratricopeptide (TPR) repeat protein